MVNGKGRSSECPFSSSRLYKPFNFIIGKNLRRWERHFNGGAFLFIRIYHLLIKYQEAFLWLCGYLGIMEVKECLPNLVGITDIECACTEVPQGKEYNITESETGYFLTDFIDLKIANINCDTANDLFDRMNKFVQKGFDDFAVMLMDEARKRSMMNQNLKPFSGWLGGSNPFVTDEDFGRWQGVVFRSKEIEATSLRVRKIRIKLKKNTLQPSNFIIVDNFGNRHHTSTLPASSNLVLEADVNITLPLYDNDSSELTYYFLHDVVDFQHNKPDCGCGGTRARRYKNFVSMNGTRTDNQADAHLDHTSSTSAFGLMIDCEMQCSFQDIFCSMTTEQRKQYGVGVLRKATINAVEWLLTRSEVNQFTLLGSEQLEGIAKLSQIEAEKASEWLLSDINLSPCYTCGARGYGVKRMLK